MTEKVYVGPEVAGPYPRLSKGRGGVQKSERSTKLRLGPLVGAMPVARESDSIEQWHSGYFCPGDSGALPLCETGRLIRGLPRSLSGQIGGSKLGAATGAFYGFLVSL